MKYTIFFSKQAIKSLKKIPKEYQIKIKEITKRLETNPFDLDIKKLLPPHKNSHRIRISSYRLFIDINTNSKEIIIADIVRRTTQTYN